jgi:hypothetical protein
MEYRAVTLIKLAAFAALLSACKLQQEVQTITVRDTVRIETVRVDTAIKVNTDTVRITKDRLKLQYVQINDTLYVQGECIGDTVYIEKTIELPVAKAPEQKVGLLEKVFIYLLALLIVLVIVRSILNHVLGK